VSEMAVSCSISVINNSVLNDSRVDCFDDFRKVRTRLQHSKFKLRVARVNDTAVQSCHLAVRYSTAAANRLLEAIAALCP
jgi:hypothetical protein